MVEPERGKQWVGEKLRELARDKAVACFWWSSEPREYKLTLEGRLRASMEVGSACQSFSAALLGACASEANVADRNEALRRITRLLDGFGKKTRPPRPRA